MVLHNRFIRTNIELHTDISYSAKKDGDIPRLAQVIKIEEERRRNERGQTIRKLEERESRTKCEDEWLEVAKSLPVRFNEPLNEVKLSLKFREKEKLKLGLFRISVVERNDQRSTAAEPTKMEFPTVLGRVRNMMLKYRDTGKKLEKMKRSYKIPPLQRALIKVVKSQQKRGLRFLRDVEGMVKQERRVNFHYADFDMLMRKMDEKREEGRTEMMKLLHKIPPQ